MKSRFRCTLRGIPLGAVLALAPATAPGQTGVDFSDGVFRNSDWRSALIESSGSPSFGAGQAVMPGDPDPNAPPGTPTAEYYREHRQSFSGLIAVGHFFAAAGYEPGQQDRSPILSLDYLFDLIQLSGEPMVFQLLLEQEGNYFAATTGESNAGDTDWTEHADTNLTASDFVNVGGQVRFHRISRTPAVRFASDI